MNQTDSSLPLPLILIIDDVIENLAVLGKNLEQRFHVRFALSGQKGLELAKTSPLPDLILLDIQMPILDGYSVIRLLKEDAKTRDIPVIFVTAQDEPADEIRGLQAGGVDFITKPIVPEIVEARINTHLALSRARKALDQQRRVLEENARLREEIDHLCRHDLKTPLSAILGVPELLLDSENLTADQRELIGLVHLSGQKMLNMINNSLTLYKIEQGSFAFKPHRVILAPLLEHLGLELSPLQQKQGVTTILTIEGQPLSQMQEFELQADSILLSTALGNLLKNAIEAAPPSSTVTLTAGRSADLAWIEIHNQGAIPAPLRECFFTKFATAGKSDGTGLGAYSAKMMIGVMGGEISMTTDEKTGTTVTVRLPAWKASAGANPHLLLLDDNETNRDWFFHMLASIGYSRVTALGSAEEGLAFLQGHAVDLVISDCNMPEFSGVDLTVKIRMDRQTSQLPVVLYSAAEDPETQERAKAAGATAFLPFFAPRERIELTLKELLKSSDKKG